MKVGISTASYYPLEMDKALGQVVDGGAECTEIFINSFGEMRPEFIRELRSILSGGSTSVTSIHPFTSAWEPMLFFGDYERRFDDGLEIYSRFAEIAAELGGQYLVLHGAFAHHAVTDEQYIDRYARLHEHLWQGYSIRLAQENVGRCMSRDPALLHKLRMAVPDISFVLDIKQTYRGIGDIDSVLDAMGDRVAHLHFSDAAIGSDCLPVGDGDFDFAKLVRRLEAIDYRGDAVLELYRDNYNDYSELWRSVEKLCEMRNMSNLHP